MDWKKPSTPIILMLSWHALAILIGIIIAIAAGARVAATWFALGLIGIPVITIGAIAWSRTLAKRAKGTPQTRPVAPADAAQLPTPRATPLHPVAEAPASGRLERDDHLTSAPVAKASGRPFQLLGSDGYPWMEVEGEFARTDAIERVIGRRLKVGQEVELVDLDAELRPEPTNAYDPNAVMVIIKGQHVGYLGRDIAAEYQAPLTRLTTAGVVPLVKARLWASKRRNWEGTGDRVNARVTLAIGQPDRLAPMNNPPSAPYSLLPWGSGLQVTGEENHLDALSDFITPTGDGVAIGTILSLEIPGPKGTTREVAEVRLDGERIGQMTPASSAHFLPTVRHLADQGRVAAVWVRVKGSAVAAQAVLQATKAHELPAEWFGAPVTIPALYPRRATAELADSDHAGDTAEIVDSQRPEPMWDD